MAKKNRRNTGWAHTKKYPHKNHPATYRRRGNDEIDYITFTHSDEVQLPNKKKVKTIPLSDNVSKQEREDNKRKGLKQGENKSYAFPKVFRGKRSALHSETKDFSLTKEDKKLVDKLFNELPVENVPTTGGSGKFSKREKKRKQ